MVNQNRIVIDNKHLNYYVFPLWKNLSLFLLFDERKITSELMGAFSYSFRGFISSLVSSILNLEINYCSGGDLVIM